jgi:hypothetical protein
MSCHNSANQNSIAIRDLQVTSSSAAAVVDSAPAGPMVIVDGLLQNTSSVLTDAVPLILGLSSVVDTNDDLLAGKRHLFRQHVPEQVLGKLVARDPGFAAKVAWRARRRRRRHDLRRRSERSHGFDGSRCFTEPNGLKSIRDSAHRWMKEGAQVTTGYGAT